MVSVPFIQKKDEPIAGYDIAYILGNRRVSGEVGLEIECEGNKFKKESLPSMWSFHKDGSLRGKDNAEYVLKKPILFRDVAGAISSLWSMFSDYGTVLDDSNRTSVHVHLNVQKFRLNRLCSFVALYFSIEELLTQWCGDHRVGNLFCLRVKDAPAIATQFRKFIERDGGYDIRDAFHYAGLNPNALYKFGSLEVRTMRGVNDPQTILDWVGILERLYTLSETYKDPRDICALFSSEGPYNYLQTVLGPYTSTVVDAIGYTPDKVRDALYEGIRISQDLCYCKDWSLFQEMDVKIDPFGRQKSQPVTGQGIAPHTISLATSAWATPATTLINPNPSLNMQQYLDMITAAPPQHTMPNMIHPTLDQYGVEEENEGEEIDEDFFTYDDEEESE